jgi:hypothetical protein
MSVMLMSPANDDENKAKPDDDKVRQAKRERELRASIERVEKRLKGTERSSDESPHDFVERKMRETLKK